MSPADGDSQPRQPQQFAEHLGARDHGNLHRPRTRHFRIREFYSRGNHDRVELARKVLRMMTVANVDTQSCEPPCGRALIKIASADVESEPHAKLGNAA